MLASYQLSIPNTAASPDLAHHFVHRLALATGLSEEEATALGNAVKLAMEYVVRFAYPENRSDELHTYCDVFPDSFEVRMQDHGVPRIPLDVKSSDSEEMQLLEALKAALGKLPKFAWELRGFEGKELTIQHPLQQAPRLTVQPRGGMARRPTGALAVNADRYVIRTFDEADAPEISELVYRTYGTSYDDEDYYFPERILAENRSGAMLSVVAVHPEGEIVGHYSLEMRDMEGIFEGSSAVVNPVHRGRGLMEKMRAKAVDSGGNLGLVGVIFLPWTVHVYSQKANEHFGAHLVGVNLSDSRPVSIQGVDGDHLHRVSTMLYYTPLKARRSGRLYVPAHLSGMVEQLLSPLGSTEGQAPIATETAVRTKRWPRDQFAEITLETAGADALSLLQAEVRHLTVHEHMETLFVNLPLTSPSCPELVRGAEELGFGFIGVGPGFCAQGDSLRMALLDEPIDPHNLQIYSQLGRDLLAFALAEQARVTA